jgi:glutamate--cysteine ligase
MNRLQERLAQLPATRLKGMRRGVEKESLRVLPTGKLAATPHPAALGSALTHEHITTDYSESQLELITGVHASVEACEAELTQVHQFTYHTLRQHAGGEMMWVGSMPCGLPADENIPIATFGSSNIGRAKSVYRMGLSHRYGRRMQTISGIHYNWSLPGVSSEEYFALIRNFRRHSFVLLYLFGASPAVCPSFVAGRDHGLQTLSDHTLYLPHATSLRMGRLGYQSDAQAKIAASFNSLESYAASLHEALTQPHPDYERIGIRNLGGEYNQLSTSLLQIENEFYGTIRPKRVIRPGERPLHALRERGVEYIEVRCMDLDPFVPVGITADTMRVLDVFLLHCLLSDSAPDSPAEIAQLARNQQRAASRGREPGLMLERGEREVSLIDWASEVLEPCRDIAQHLDELFSPGGEKRYSAALNAAMRSLAAPQQLSSARLLERVAQDFEGSYTRFGRHQSEAARDAVMALPYSEAMHAAFVAQAQASVDAQARVEAADTLPFETWRQQYLAPTTLMPSAATAATGAAAAPSAVAV